MSEHIKSFNTVSAALNETRKSTERMMFKQLELAHAMEDISQKLIFQSGTEVESLTASLMRVGESELEIAKEHEKHAGMMAQLLDEPLQDHIAMMAAASELCNARERAALALTNK